jgi:hypothetical protein
VFSVSKQGGVIQEGFGDRTRRVGSLGSRAQQPPPCPPAMLQDRNSCPDRQRSLPRLLRLFADSLRRGGNPVFVRSRQSSCQE